MSGKKISEMTAITGAQLDQTNDVLPILDVSDTSNPNKKISIQELASALGSTTNVSLVLDGSNNLILTDSAGNNVTADLSSLLDDTNTTNASLSLATNTLTLTDSAGDSVDVDLSTLDNSGLTLADVTANGAVTGDSLMIGSTDFPSTKLHIVDTFPTLRLENSSTTSVIGDAISSIEFYSSDTSGNYPAVAAAIKAINYNSFGSSTGLSFYVNGDQATEQIAFAFNPSGQLGIRTTTPSVTLDIQGTDAVQLTSGTEAQRPTTPANGMIRYNSDDDVFEGYAGDTGAGDGDWGSIAKFYGALLKPTPSNTEAVEFGAGFFRFKTSATSSVRFNTGSVLTFLDGVFSHSLGRVNNSFLGSTAIGTISSPSVTLDIQGTDAVQLTAGTTAERPTTPANGMIRYNSDDDVFEGYAGGAWEKTSGLTLADVTANGSTTGTACTFATIQSNNRFRVLQGTTFIGDLLSVSNVLTLQSATNTDVSLGSSTVNNAIFIKGTNGKIGISQTSPTVTLDINGTDAVQLTSGTTAERPTAAAGMIRFNTDTLKFEGFDGTSWIDLH